MSVATSTALSILAIGAGAGTSIYGANKAANANKKASEIEGAAADKALDFSKDVYNRREQELAPYRFQGGAALSKFSELLGLPPTPQEASWVPKANPLSGAPPTIPGDGTPSRLNYGGAPQSMAGAPSQSVAESFAVVQTPNGQKVRVPQGQLAEAMAHGGKVVS